eukprot:934899-Pyramimonas_sp.AAC.1
MRRRGLVGPSLSLVAPPRRPSGRMTDGAWRQGFTRTRVDARRPSRRRPLSNPTSFGGWWVGRLGGLTSPPPP